ncbi:sugar ABC transporter ATP-binding protein [Kiloniella laminariae]|uniref:Sugar ABC transporter ATP-binding protein n=1 Tax=Kiloniella laminariae TaxID=454162 RepID=A0ABT4LGQ5_9PROT|nr:sugar ABC transporter ATP-binding protein [Kiloniella laminariae]MCZ4280281.1 sugar ABC transporter ATP-binding protein [Kiloniella laminariae]
MDIVQTREASQGQTDNQETLQDISPDILTVRDLHKNFGGVKALKGVSLSLRAGEVHALVGENGAGKSTLIKILTGVFQPSAGDILLDGQVYKPAGPRDAKFRGIQVVHQEFNLLPHLSVAENISFEQMPRTRLGLLDKKEMDRRARVALDAIGLQDVDVNARVYSLGIAHRQLIEIARALQSDSRILILDEPTATLTDRETDRLFNIVAAIRAQGVTVVFVSHHLNEVFANCDRVTVLRSGETIVTEEISETSPDQLVALMVGRRLAKEMALEKTTTELGSVALSLQNFRVAKSPYEEGVSFDLRYGEILGIAGLVGAGRTELLRGIFGIDPVASGQMMREGTPVSFASPREAIKSGIGFVTEDRKDEGLILDMAIAANVALAALEKVSQKGLLNRLAELSLADRLGSMLKLKSGGLSDRAASLSGGNQQKVVIAKWLARDPSVLLLDEPTRGVDVGAKAEIYAIMRSLAQKGVAMLVVSSELPELITLCDRILVLSDHRVQGEIPREAFSEEAILRLAYQRKDQGI